MTLHDNIDEPTVRRAAHPWAVLDGDTPLFHTPGSFPPEYARDDALEALWRAGQALKAPRTIIQLELWEKAA